MKNVKDVPAHGLPLSRKNNLSQQTFGQKPLQTNGSLNT